MRRTDKEITDRTAIDQIIWSSQVLRLGMSKNEVPYIVPLSFGYDGSAFYVHTALTGRKLEFFQANPGVCFEVEQGVTLRPHPTDPCEWSFSFQCIVGYGTLSELVDVVEKQEALVQIMRHYAEGEWKFPPAALAGIRVWKIKVDRITGKQSKDNI